MKVNPSYVDLKVNAGMPGRVFSIFDNPNTFAQVLLLLLPLVLDGGIQRLTRYESGNIRRLLTGMLFGYALVGLLVLSTIGAARWGYQLGKQLAV